MIQLKTTGSSFLSLLLLFGACCTSTAGSGADAVLSAQTTCQQLIGFAEHLQDQQDYFRAIGEYKRVLYFCPDSSLRIAAVRGIADSYFSAGRYREVIEWSRTSEALIAEGTSTSLLVGHALFRLGDYDQAFQDLTAIDSTKLGEIGFGQASYLAGLSLVRLGRGAEAVPYFTVVAESSPYRKKADLYAERLIELDSFPTKNPNLAGALGVVPGLGYAYTEHYGTALASLVVNGLLWWATINAFQNDDTAAGAIFSVFAVGFYLGNIVGSAQSAYRYNAYQSRQFQSRFPE